LERETGVSKSTIHFYVRQGILPRPQKTAASRALYSEDHVRLLHKITALKESGLSLSQIKAALQDELSTAQANEVDLAEKEYDRVHRAILRAATEQFSTKGYEQTHVADIVQKVAITPQVFYSHFPSKLQLLVEAFHTFMSWNLAFVETDEMQKADLGQRLLRRLVADATSAEFGSDVLAHIRAEHSRDRAEKLRLAEQAWEVVVRQVKQDLENAIPAGTSGPAVPLDLLAYSLIGAHHNASTRASWDDQYNRADVLRTHLWLWFAVVAALKGEIDINSRVAAYEDLVQEMATRAPEVPPAPDE
jgi:DNA-binding transcriptional MerR regulator